MIDKRQLYRANMSRYTTLIMVNGQYRDLRDSELDQIKSWVKDGGNLILFKNAIDWAKKEEMIKLEKAKNKKNNQGTTSRYTQSSAGRGANVLGGAIFEAKMDLSHPLCYGYDDENIALFRRGTSLYEAPSNTYSAPVKYTQSPIASGYIPRGFDQNAAGKVAVTVHQSGRGKIICFQDNLLFRGYWYGGNKMFGNSIFFTDIIDSRTAANE